MNVGIFFSNFLEGPFLTLLREFHSTLVVKSSRRALRDLVQLLVGIVQMVLKSSVGGPCMTCIRGACKKIWDALGRS